MALFYYNKGSGRLDVIITAGFTYFSYTSVLPPLLNSATIYPYDFYIDFLYVVYFSYISSQVCLY